MHSLAVGAGGGLDAASAAEVLLAVTPPMCPSEAHLRSICAYCLSRPRRLKSRVHECGAQMTVSDILLRNCSWGFKCDKVWDDLSPTSFENVRHCNACDSPVHFCEDNQQLLYALKRNWCVSFVADLTASDWVAVDPLFTSTGLITLSPQATFADLAASVAAFSPPIAGYASGSWAEQSPLHLLGYRVGRKGLSQAKRRRLLEAFYTVLLPHEYPATYAEHWGPPASPARRTAMAQHVRWLARQAAERQNAEAMSVAIADWEKDAAFIEAADW